MMKAGRGGKSMVRGQKSNQALTNPSMKRSQLLANKSVVESRARLHAASRAPGTRRKDDDGGGEYDDPDGDWAAPKELVKPANQLELSEAELKEELTRVLTADNPHAPSNIIRFNFKENSFKQVAAIDHLAMHFSMDSNLLHKESDEAHRQQAQGEESSEEEEEEEEEEDEEGGEPSKKVKGHPEKRLRNQFNFSDRASQTLNNPYRERGTATEPPPRANFSAMANQMEMFDAYVDDLIAQEKAKEKAKGGGGGGGKGGTGGGGAEDERRRGGGSELQSDDITRVSRSSKIMERMVNQNTFDDILQDFKYYEDTGDDFRESKGSLLPLWRFKFEKAGKMAVTALCWSTFYKDLFVVGLGSYDFASQQSGTICFHSLKNPTYPEFLYTVPSGVMCLDVHPEHSFLMAVGHYDGAVAVYDLNETGSTPVYKSTTKTGKHSDPVWQVCWQPNDFEGYLNFYSVSSDGRVVTWRIVKNELQYQDAVTLQAADSSSEEGGKASSATAIGFSPSADHLYLVGTEEGMVYKCSKSYSSHFLDKYQAHHMAVHALRWNPFHQDVFASCGADWTVKIWDHTRRDAMFTFDLSSVVGDLAWAPYSSTVFAAVTADGKVHVFDLSINKYEPLCVQSVIQKKRTKLTHVTFNPVHPILVVGDDRGSVICLKLSPNLRKALKEKNRSRESEVAKMEKLISFVREPLLEKEKDGPAKGEE